MVSAIVSVNGKILPVDIKRGRAVYAGTRIPVVNESKLQGLPVREKIEGLIREAQEAQAKEAELQSYWRACEERAKREPESVREGILRLLHEGSKWEFSELLEETNPPIEALWRDEDSKSLFVQPPEESLLVKKLVDGNHNFTLAEAKQLLRQGILGTKEELQENFDLFRALLEVNPESVKEAYFNAFSSLAQKGNEQSILEEAAKLPEQVLKEVLGRSNKHFLRIAISRRLPNLLRLYFAHHPLLEESQKIIKDSIEEIVKNSKTANKQTSIDTVQVLLETLSIEKRKLMLTCNGAKHLRNAAVSNNLEMARMLLSMGRQIDESTYERMLYRSKSPIVYDVVEQLENQNQLEKPQPVLNKPNQKKQTSQNKTLWVFKGSFRKVDIVEEQKNIENTHPQLNMETYKKLFPIMKVASVLEGNSYAELDAYKLALICPNFDDAIAWISRKVRLDHQDSLQPVHDAMLFDLPSTHDWNSNDWSVLLKRLGSKILDYIPVAPVIERAYKEMGGNEATGLEFNRLNLKDLEAIASKINYSGSEINQAFADFCASVKPKVTQEGFNRGLQALRYLELNPINPQQDKIPEVGIIDGADFGHPSLYMRKLSKSRKLDQMISLSIGRFVRCCNHLDGATSEMAIAQTVSPNGGVYALFRKVDGKMNLSSMPVAKTTVWRGKDSITFNSWEFPDSSTEYKQTGGEFILEAARRAIANGNDINDVTLGGHSTFGFKPVTPKTPIEEKTRSYDSKNQTLVLSKKDLKSLQIRKLQEKTIESLERLIETEEEPIIFSLKELLELRRQPIVLAS